MPRAATSKQLGMIPWYSYLATDLAKGRDFYQKLFSWKIDSSAINGSDHAMFTANGDQFADLGKADAQTRSHWATYVVVDNLENTLERVERLGGRVLQKPVQLPEIGAMALIEDPFGASIWAYVPEDASRITWAMGTTFGRVCWHELLVPDAEAAKSFYGEVFQWNFKRDEKTNLWLISCGDKILGGILKTPPHAQGAPAMWSLYFLTSAIDDTNERALALGAQQFMPKTEVPDVGWFSFLKDPAGATFYLWQPK